MTSTLIIDFLLTDHIDRNRRLGATESVRKFESDRAKSEEVIAKKRGLTGSEIHSRYLLHKSFKTYTWQLVVVTAFGPAKLQQIGASDR